MKLNPGPVGGTGRALALESISHLSWRPVLENSFAILAQGPCLTALLLKTKYYLFCFANTPNLPSTLVLNTTVSVAPLANENRFCGDIKD